MKLIYATAAAVLLACPAAAETECAPRADVLSGLTGKYGEVRQSMALASTGSLAEVFANLETGTWTVVYTTPGSAESCVVAHGGSYIVTPPEPQGEPS